jgi:EmrB/QacA subfamily drug resistance transporter
MLLPLLVAVTFFMENLDGTVIATALPQMGASFGVGPADLSIGLTAYLLTLAVFIPVSGWVADRFGGRTVFAAAITVFTLASLLCGLSNSVTAFVLARIVQGIGGAMMVPVGRMVVMRATPKPDIMRAMATITWPGLVAPVLGPPVGGFITTYATWRWIFWLNLPVGLIALALALTLVPNERGQRRPFDRAGFILSGAALAGLMYGLDEFARPGADWRAAAAILLTSAALAVVAVRHAKRHPHPMLDLGPSRIPSFAVNIWSGSAFRIAFNAMPFMVPLLLQVGFGMTAFDAGLLILIGAAGDLAIKAITVPLFRAAGFRRVLIVNSVLGALALLATTLLSRGSPAWTIALVMLGYGVTRSLNFSAGATLAMVDIPPGLAAPASTLMSMLMQMSSGMGVAFGAITLHAAVWFRGGNPDAPDIADFRIVFAAAALLALSAVIGYIKLSPAAGAEATGRA